MRPDFIAEVILARTQNLPITKNLEKALLEQHGAIPNAFTEPLPDKRFNLIPRLLEQYFRKVSFARTPLITHFDTINTLMIWVPIGLTLISAVVLAGSWIAGTNFFVRLGLFVLTLLFGALMKWSLSQGLKLAYALIDHAKPGNLIVFVLGKDLHVTTTSHTGKLGMLTGDDIDVKTHNLKELVVTKVLWKRADHKDSIEYHLLVVICCLYALENAEFTIRKEQVLDRLSVSVSHLKMNNDDLSVTYLEMLLCMEREEYSEMQNKIDYLLTREVTFEVSLYKEALNFLSNHPPVPES